MTDENEASAIPCADKIAFDSLKQARAAANVAAYQHGAKLTAYQCPRCSLWHLATRYE